jgi:hypothetical protein
MELTPVNGDQENDNGDIFERKRDVGSQSALPKYDALGGYI